MLKTIKNKKGMELVQVAILIAPCSCSGSYLQDRDNGICKQDFRRSERLMKYHLKKMGQAGSRNLQIKRTSGHRKIQKCQRRNGVFSVWLHKCRSNKKGEEMVEASIVLPILILTILSLILLILYYYACLNCQVELSRGADFGY